MALKNIIAKWAGKCSYCALPFGSGQKVSWDSATKAVYHAGCAGKVTGAGATLSGGAPGGATLKPSFAASHVAYPQEAPIVTVKSGAGAGAGKVEPKTQKARGIVTLQKAGMLGQSQAQIAVTEDEAITRAQLMGLGNGGCFMRPCPITPRHGFVDSRIVKTVDEVKGVWAEAKAADPQAEAILMPFIKATHNMVWQPGMLGIGPGHDGATAGHGSVSVFLEPDYSPTWKKLAESAGVNLAAQNPFIEAVCSPVQETVITQIRAGDKGVPTEPDLVQAAMTVGEVITIDPAAKSDPGAMLAWEETAKGLKPGYHVVYNPGGNLGDHWSVHARLNDIAVVTTFQPHAGEHLDARGTVPAPIEPMAVVWGYLGGLLHPGLRDGKTARRRALVAAILGTHHGLRMGGDAGVFLGASIAFLLRLSQAIVWGEARHAEHTGLSRDQIYKSLLDDWMKGRAGLGAKTTLFHTAKWSSAFGGKNWAAIGHATIALDKAMLDLVKSPSETYAKAAIACLTTTVNLAHNTGWAFNKFMDSSMFDLAAQQDPRPALLAGPIWYDAAVASNDSDRLALLGEIEQMEPIVVSHKAPTASKTVKGKAGKGTGQPAIEQLMSMMNKAAQSSGGESKAGVLNAVTVGGTVTVPAPVTKAQIKLNGAGGHLQLLTENGYYALELHGLTTAMVQAIGGQPTGLSMAGTDTVYHLLVIVPADAGPFTVIGTPTHTLFLTQIG